MTGTSRTCQRYSRAAAKLCAQLKDDSRTHITAATQSEVTSLQFFSINQRSIQAKNDQLLKKQQFHRAFHAGNALPAIGFENVLCPNRLS
jgi:hypothetical protein